MGLIEKLGSGPVGLDSSVLIYYVEEHPDYLPVLDPLFEALETGGIEAVTSALTLLEVLVVPYRAGEPALAERYEALLTRSRGLRTMELDLVQLRTAAHFRAEYGMRTPDALQIAAALATRCTAFLTNDRRLPAISELPVLQLRDLM